MTNLEETKNKVDCLLADGGLTTEYREQSVRQLLRHLYVAIDIYRYMSVAERNMSGYWYRHFKSSFSLTGFLKEKKRKRDKEKSPLHPSYKKESGVIEKKEIKQTNKGGASLLSLNERKEAFLAQCHKYDERYGKEMVEEFYVHWSEENNDGIMRFELEATWSTAKRLFKWSRSAATRENQIAAIRLDRAKKGKSAAAPFNTNNSEEQKRAAAEREEANAKLEAEIAKNKADAVSIDEYLAKNPNGGLAKLLGNPKK